MNVKYAAFQTKRRFGVEIEINRHLNQQRLVNIVNDAVGDKLCEQTGWGYSCNNTRWIVKPDSSCGDLGDREKDGGGYEIASAVGSTSKHINKIEAVVDALKQSKAEVNPFCGLHVQVEIRDFSDQQAATLLAYWCRIERIIGHAVPKHRIQNLHCKFHTLNKKLWPSAELTTNAKDFWHIMKLKSSLGAPAKRNTMTLINYQRTKSHSYEWDLFDRPTVELRLPESSLDSYDVKNWARLFVHFVETCANKEFPKTLQLAKFDEMLEILGLRDSQSQSSILSPGLFETKCWLLHRFQKYARSQQVSRVVSKCWQQMVSPMISWRFAFPQVEKPFIQVSSPEVSSYNDRSLSCCSKAV